MLQLVQFLLEPPVLPFQFPEFAILPRNLPPVRAFGLLLTTDQHLKGPDLRAKRGGRPQKCSEAGESGPGLSRLGRYRRKAEQPSRESRRRCSCRSGPIQYSVVVALKPHRIHRRRRPTAHILIQINSARIADRVPLNPAAKHRIICSIPHVIQFRFRIIPIRACDSLCSLFWDLGRNVSRAIGP